MKVTLLLAAVALGGCNTSSTGSITPPPDDPSGLPPGDTTPPPGDPAPPPADPAETVLSLTGHFIAEIADGPDTTRRDRTRTAVGVDVATRPPGGSPTEGDIRPKGPMSGGDEIPGATGLKRNAALSTELEQFFSNDAEDTFLSIRQMSPDVVIGEYVVLSPAAGVFVRGMAVAGNPTRDMPVSNGATFTGEAFLKSRGGTDMTGRTTLNAEFAPGGGTVSGKIDQLQSGGRVPDILGLDLVLQQTQITGNTFSGGKIGLVTAGTADAVGTVVSSDYGGGFFGAGAGEAGGTFHLEATDVPLPGVLNPTTFEAIGAFHGSQAP